MRDIRFRAWLPGIKKMTYSHTIPEWRNTSIQQDDNIIFLQFTELKDNNRRDIHEGDILDGSWLNPMSNQIVERRYEVAYENGRFLAKLIGHHPYGTTLLYFENEKSEVIGNIYENPELL